METYKVKVDGELVGEFYSLVEAEQKVEEYEGKSPVIECEDIEI